MLNTKKDKLRLTAIVYVALPLIVFFVGYLRWYYALIGIIALCVVLYSVIKHETKIDFLIKPKTVVLVFFIALVWSYLGGMNGFWFQSSDWNCRNAIYFDLIQYTWPVTYDMSGGALVYYIGFWLPPAALAKLCMLISGSLEVGLMAGRMLLWIWGSIGITISILLLFQAIKANGKRQKIICCLIFVFFSGLDLVGSWAYNNLETFMQPIIGRISGPHIEWWASIYQYSSMTTQLYWVFNQVIITWVVILLFLEDEGPQNYVFYCCACMLSGPFPAVGLAILMVAKAIIFCIGKIKVKQNPLTMIFSTQNILTFMCAFPFVALYLLSANAVNDISVETGTSFRLASYLTKDLYIFILLEAGFYLLIILIDHYKNPMYYTIFFMLIVFPAIHVGLGNDFCMRASIPPLFLLMFYIIKFLLDNFGEKGNNSNYSFIKKTLTRILVVFLLIGAITPAIEIYRGFYHVIENNTIMLEDDSLMTFNTKENHYNFVTKNPNEYLFFKQIAKRRNG